MSLIRTRWAAIGAAVAVTLGAGGIALNTAGATTSSGERLVYHPLTPCRIIDTRPNFQVGPRNTPLGADDTIDIDGTGTTGNCAIPGDAVALALNVTATDATLPTFLTVWANGQPLPLASAMNPAPNQPPTPNAVTTDLGTNNQFSIYNKQGTVHVFADATGYYTHHTHDDRYYTEAEIDQILDTRLPRVQHVSIGAMSFHPTESTTTYYSRHTHSEGAYIVDGGTRLVAPLTLPDGAEVTAVRARYYDNSTADLRIEILCKDTDFGNRFTLADRTTGRFFDFWRHVGLDSLPFTVNNSDCSYYARVSSDDWPIAEGALRISNLVFTVELPS